MKHEPVIYQIKNLKNGNLYIGSSIWGTRRWQRHIKDLRMRRHHSKYLQRAWNKYGEVNFKFEIIEPIEFIQDKVQLKKILLEREQFYMDVLKPQYNMCKIAGSSLGCVVSEETKRKLSIANKGKHLLDEHKHKISIAMTGVKNHRFGKPCSYNSIIATKLVCTGRKISEKQKQQISLKNKGSKRSVESRIKMQNSRNRRVFLDNFDHENLTILQTICKTDNINFINC